MIRKTKYAFALARLVALTVSAAHADDQALIDALVRKGILTQKDAESIEAEVSKNPAVIPAPSSPLKLAPWIKELKLAVTCASAINGTETGSGAFGCPWRTNADSKTFSWEPDSHADGKSERPEPRGNT